MSDDAFKSQEKISVGASTNKKFTTALGGLPGRSQLTKSDHLDLNHHAGNIAR